MNKKIICMNKKNKSIKLEFNKINLIASDFNFLFVLAK